MTRPWPSRAAPSFRSPRRLGLRPRLQPGQLGGVEVVLAARGAVVHRQLQVARAPRHRRRAASRRGRARSGTRGSSRRARPRGRRSSRAARQSLCRAASRPRLKKWNGGYRLDRAPAAVRAASASAARPWPGVGLGEVGQRPGVLRLALEHVAEHALGLRQVVVPQVDDAERVVRVMKVGSLAQRLGRPGSRRRRAGRAPAPRRRGCWRTSRAPCSRRCRATRRPRDSSGGRKSMVIGLRSRAVPGVEDAPAER